MNSLEPESQAVTLEEQPMLPTAESSLQPRLTRTLISSFKLAVCNKDPSTMSPLSAKLYSVKQKSIRRRICMD